MLKVDELEKTITVASRDPAHYGLDEVELSRRRNWIGSARNQVFLDIRYIIQFQASFAFSITSKLVWGLVVYELYIFS